MRLLALCLLSLLIGFPAVGTAEPITFNYTGEISAVDPSAAPSLGPLGVMEGEPFTLSYTFESTTSDIDPSPFARYDFGILNVEFSVGDYTIVNDMPYSDNRMTVIPGGMLYSVWIDAADNPALGLDPQLEFYLNFSAPFEFLLVGEALPTTPPDPSLFEFAFVDIRENYDPPGVGLTTIYITGDITAVPEPAPIALVLLAVASLLYLRRRA